MNREKFSLLSVKERKEYFQAKNSFDVSAILMFIFGAIVFLPVYFYYGFNTWGFSILIYVMVVYVAYLIDLREIDKVYGPK